MNAGRITTLIIGIVVALFALAMLVGGAGALWLSGVNRDADGFVSTPRYELTTSDHAITSVAADLRGAPEDWIPLTGRIRTRSTVVPEGEAPVFLGIGPTDAVEAYLDGVAHTRVVDLGSDPDEVQDRTIEGTSQPADPAAQDFWVARTDGTGTQTLTWRPSPGNWTAVVMRADGAAGVVVTASGGIAVSGLWPIGLGLLLGGLLLLVIAGGLIVIATSRRHDDAARPAGRPLPPATDGAYPLTLEARLDEPLSRALWLVKWLLAIPHFVVLIALWAAFFLLTIVAGIAILFTGRYPRPIFEFNVGVLRWSWRVAYYSHAALGTDRYPPFTLAHTDHPASLSVAYPEQLSRGLVLVKWWLLALPHYIIVGVLVGGAVSWSIGDRAGDNWQTVMSGGLIGILALIAGVILLVTARYPRGLFDLIMGLNRWVYRVIAYAALMTDTYPPFRLDVGGSEPPVAPPPPPPGRRGGDAAEHPVGVH